MNRIIDKVIAFACCAFGLALASWNGETVVALLVAIAASALCELVDDRWRPVPALAYAVAAIVAPALSPFLPLAVYDLARASFPWMRAVWAVPVVVSAVAQTQRGDEAHAAALVLGCAVAFLLGWRAERERRAEAESRERRDDLREEAIALESRYAELADRQDLEVRLATLGERSRIAREIHDNVGHLLTRSVLQVNALQVVHRDDERLVGELATVGATVNEALDAVRASVHDLHYDGFDLETQLRSAAQACEGVDVDVEYRAERLPTPVAYSFLAIAREALSNTVRHSDADRVRIAVTEHPGFFRLVVHDNGTVKPLMAVDGSGAAHEAEGIGLSTMRDRTTALGGVFRTSFDQGFVVFATVPKDALAAGGAMPSADDARERDSSERKEGAA